MKGNNERAAAQCPSMHRVGISEPTNLLVSPEHRRVCPHQSFPLTLSFLVRLSSSPPPSFPLTLSLLVRLSSWVGNCCSAGVICKVIKRMRWHALPRSSVSSQSPEISTGSSLYVQRGIINGRD